MKMKKDNKYVWWLAAICMLSLFLFLGEALFNTRGEPREAVVALSMLEYGNWVLPVNNGVDLAYKPPFFHWLIALCSLPFGEVSEYTSRMPSALALAVMVMGGYAFYAHRRGREVAFWAALLTLTNFEVHRAGTNCRVDMVLTAMMVLALYQLYKWGEKDLKGMPWAGILCLSAAFLTKGPVGAALPCLVVAVFLWIRKGCFWRVFGRFFLVGLWACVLPLCWYVAAYFQGGERFLQLVYEENVLRLLGKMSYESHVNPAYYNVITVVAGYVPYTLLVLLSLFVLKYRKVQSRPGEWWSRLKAYVRGMDDARLFSLLSIVIIFVFYCIPKSKRSVYLLPIYPFIAYFLAEYILYLVRCHRRVVVLFGHIMAGLAVGLFVVFVGVRMEWIPESIFSGRHAAENIAFMRALATAPVGLKIGVILLPVIAAGVYWAWHRKSERALLASVTGIVFSIFFVLDGFYQPVVLNVKSDYPVARRIASLVPEGRIYSYKPNTVVGNRMHPFTLNFYLKDRVAPFEDLRPASGYLIVGSEEVETFKERFPDYQVEEVFNSGHRSCDDRKVICFYRFCKR